MNRAFAGNIIKSAALFVIKIAMKDQRLADFMDIKRAAVMLWIVRAFETFIINPDINPPQIPALALGIQLAGNRHARPQSAQHHLAWGRAAVIAAISKRLVGRPLMLPRACSRLESIAQANVNRHGWLLFLMGRQIRGQSV